VATSAAPRTLSAWNARRCTANSKALVWLHQPRLARGLRMWMTRFKIKPLHFARKTPGAAPPNPVTTQRLALIDDLEAAVGIADRAGFWRQPGQGGRRCRCCGLFYPVRAGRNTGGRIATVGHALVFDPFTQGPVHIIGVYFAGQIISACRGAQTGRIADAACRNIGGWRATYLIGHGRIAQCLHLTGGRVALDGGHWCARLVIQR